MVGVFAVITVSGFGSFLATSYYQPKASVVVHNAPVYHLKLIEPMNTGWNATLAQPKFFVVGPKGLESNCPIP